MGPGVNTLSSPVRPYINSLCPTMDIVVFSGEKGIYCYRKSGHMVWNVLGRKNNIPIKCSWSPNGQLIAIIYEDGMYQILQSNNGRTISNVSGMQVSCIVWSNFTPPQVSPVLPFKDPSELLPRLSNHMLEGNMMVLGTENGGVQVFLSGVFNLGEVCLFSHDGESKRKVEYLSIHPREKYIVATLAGKKVEKEVKTELVVLKLDFAQVGVSELNNLTMKSAQVAASLEELCTGTDKYETDLDDIKKLNARFWESLSNSLEDCQIEVLDLLLRRDPSEKAQSWMDLQHENGFKRWYKGIQQAYESMKKNMVEVLIPATEHIIVKMGDLLGTVNANSNAFGSSNLGPQVEELQKALDTAGSVLRALYRSLRFYHAETALFETFAASLEMAFAAHINRAMNATLKDKSSVKETMEYIKSSLSKTKLFSMKTFVTQFDKEFKVAVKRTRDYLRNHIKVVHRHCITGLVEDIRFFGPTCYLLVHPGAKEINSSQDTKLYKIEGDNCGTLSEVAKFTSNIARFGGGQGVVALIDHDIVMYEVDETGIKQTNKTRLKFPPGSLAAKDSCFCVLSHDYYHYAMLDYNSENF